MDGPLSNFMLLFLIYVVGAQCTVKCLEMHFKNLNT